jgi:hypothetical protein
MTDAVADEIMTVDDLLQFLAEQTVLHWRDHEKPWLISSIPGALKEARGVDYRTILGETKLKAFTLEREGPTFKVVTHPTQRAKVGLIPAAETFEFGTEEVSAPLTAAGPESDKPLRMGTASATLRFLRALSNLSDEDLANIVIPTHVLVKLLADK